MATNREYTEDFDNNVKVSLEAENIAKQLLEQIYWDEFTSVRDDPAYYHIGDLLDSAGRGFDCKDDGVINRTGNVFCETKKHWFNSGKTTDGWMRNGEYDYLVVLDRVDNHIYVLDFPVLKKIYKCCGKFKCGINMGDNYTDGFIVSLDRCKENNALIHAYSYIYDKDHDFYDIVV